MPEHPSPAERREQRPLQSCTSLLEGMARTAGDFGLAYIDKTQALDLAAAVRDLADENEWLRAEHERLKQRAGVWRLTQDRRAAERDAARTEVAALREALELIDRHGCSTYWGGTRCLDTNSGRTRNSGEGATSWCDPCVARAALSNPQPQTAAEDQQ